jgi:hypothetical protein
LYVSLAFVVAESLIFRIVTISVPKDTSAMIVLSQMDTRYFDTISGRSHWTFDFLLYKKGEKEPIAESLHSRMYARSVNVEVDLQAGEYVVHVRLDRHVYRERVKYLLSCDDVSLISVGRTISTIIRQGI